MPFEITQVILSSRSRTKVIAMENDELRMFSGLLNTGNVCELARDHCMQYAEKYAKKKT